MFLSFTMSCGYLISFIYHCPFLYNLLLERMFRWNMIHFPLRKDISCPRYKAFKTLSIDYIVVVCPNIQTTYNSAIVYLFLKELNIKKYLNSKYNHIHYSNFYSMFFNYCYHDIMIIFFTTLIYLLYQ